MFDLTSSIGNDAFSFDKFVPKIPESPIKSFFQNLGNKFKEVAEDFGPEICGIGMAIAGAVAIAFPELAIVEIAEVIQTIEVVGGLISAVVKSLCGMEGDIEPADIGMRAESALKGPDDFEDYEAYLNYLNNDVQQDPQKLELLTDEEKAAYSLAGNSIMHKVITDKTGMEISPEFYVDAQKVNMDGKEVYATIESANEHGMDDVQLGAYLSGGLDEDEQYEMREVITEGISLAHPEMSESEVDDKLFDMKLSFDEG
ncbi:MAG: hypothetical protein NC177_02655 [Ruminococcus flavefaciens]|nr:hypothetical protein [Ruminococcus flavefaciens]